MKNINDRTHCDMCGAKIENGKCDCGIWGSPEEMKEHPFLKAIEYFHDAKLYTATSDAPNLGCAMVLFRGNYNDCEKVKKFIYELHGRPYYD